MPKILERWAVVDETESYIIAIVGSEEGARKLARSGEFVTPFTVHVEKEHGVTSNKQPTVGIQEDTLPGEGSEQVDLERRQGTASPYTVWDGGFGARDDGPTC